MIDGVNEKQSELAEIASAAKSPSVSVSDIVSSGESTMANDEQFIALPPHIRYCHHQVLAICFYCILNLIFIKSSCASHTLNLIASSDIDLATFELKEFKKKVALRNSLSKVRALWNKIGGRSIDVAEKSFEAFGVSLVTPCPTRWNSLYDSLHCFSQNHVSLENVNKLFRTIGFPLMTNQDIELLTEYMYVMEPVAKALDIFQGEKDVFMGIGVVLPLLAKLKQELALREFPNLEPIRTRVLQSVDKRYYA